MNWLGRLILGTDFGKCPRCQGVESVRICSTVGWRIDGKRVRSTQIGARFQCDRCALIYSVGPAGAFIPAAAPAAHAPATAPAPAARTPTPEADDLPHIPSPPERPIPRERPRA